jgi:prepilin-type N-terminal cleavage/methylation domain-containing protein
MLPTGNRGFTLIEVLVALVILAVGIVGIGRSYVTSVGALGIGRESTESLCLLKQKISEIELGAIEAGGIDAGYSSGSFEGDYSDYEWEAEVRPVYAKLNEVDLKVRKRGSRRVFTLATYLYAKE